MVDELRSETRHKQSEQPEIRTSRDDVRRDTLATPAPNPTLSAHNSTLVSHPASRCNWFSKFQKNRSEGGNRAGGEMGVLAANVHAVSRLASVCGESCERCLVSATMVMAH